MSSDFTTDIGSHGAKGVTLTQDKVLGARECREDRFNSFSSRVHEFCPAAWVECVFLGGRVDTTAEIGFISEGQAAFM